MELVGLIIILLVLCVYFTIPIKPIKPYYEPAYMKPKTNTWIGNFA